MPPRPRKPRASKAEKDCKAHCCAVSDELKESIRASVEEGRGRSMFDGAPASHGAMCRCGLARKPPGLALHVQDDGICVVHPDRPPQPWVRGAGGA
jgi:hypothetical protein